MKLAKSGIEVIFEKEDEGKMYEVIGYDSFSSESCVGVIKKIQDNKYEFVPIYGTEYYMNLWKDHVPENYIILFNNLEEIKEI